MRSSTQWLGAEKRPPSRTKKALQWAGLLSLFALIGALLGAGV